VRSRRTLLIDLAKALALTLLAALAAAPLAVVWGISHAQVDDYLGPHRVNFASNFSGEVEVNLGPIGNAYLASHVRPIGLTITVGGVGSASENLNSLFSEQTLAAYTSLYTDPTEAIAGILERLAHDAVREGLKAEAVLLLGVAVWRLRRQLLSPRIVSWVTTRRALVIYLTVVALIVGSIFVPRSRKVPDIRCRLPMTAASRPSRWTACCSRTYSIAALKASSCSVRDNSEQSRRTSTRPASGCPNSWMRYRSHALMNR